MAPNVMHNKTIKGLRDQPQAATCSLNILPKTDSHSNIIAESFYYVTYGSSIITSKVKSNNISNENTSNGVSVVYKTKRQLKCQKNNCFWNIVSLETPVFLCFHY